MGCTDLRGSAPPFREKKRGMEMETDMHTAGTVPAIGPRIAVVGIGGAGCNIINDVHWADGSMDTVAINTDKHSLRQTNADRKVCLCRDVTKGEGAKGDILLGERCGKAHADEIREALAGHDTVFIIAGMGGGTGTGVAPVVAAVAHSLNMITFVIAVKPFSFEAQRMKAAKEGISRISAICPMTVVIDNDRIAANMPDMTMEDAFRTVNNSVVRFIIEQKKKLADAMADQLLSIDAMIEEGGEPHSLSAFADITAS
ncbi:MAG: cell division protein FtsZ [Methanomassiliicoccaceae archaeon]|nr:cell division protein FtsZ [Methanomassiliicoccaceae archaeon]